ncbi:hypothetical protein SAY87_004120 [Trapa incisa]|uniref:Uncharacterized protein n=1 Tax=Trapa incisa TaxID=236973 RepID=A0AAN7JQP2_9MYRT|nr:hypothetical protein SAY87_004120 [Trapa incisa]
MPTHLGILPMAIEAAVADRHGGAELQAVGDPRRRRLADLAEKPPGVLRDEEVRAVNPLVADPAEIRLVRLTIHPRRHPTELAAPLPLH